MMPVSSAECTNNTDFMENCQGGGITPNRDIIMRSALWATDNAVFQPAWRALSLLFDLTFAHDERAVLRCDSTHHNLGFRVLRLSSRRCVMCTPNTGQVV
jgi:hypothetical protein